MTQDAGDRDTALMERAARACGELSDLLAGLGQHHWATWLLEAERLLRAGDPRGAEHALAAVDASGGPAAQVLSPARGHTVPAPEAAAEQARLALLCETVRALARAVRDGPV